MRAEQEKTLAELFSAYPALRPLDGELRRAFALLRAAFRGGGKLLVCGNGGSAADSAHIVGELMKGFRKKRPLPPGEAAALPKEIAARLQGALPALDLTAFSALSTAIANDVDAEMVFAQQVYGYGRAGDALLALSTSGGSKNVGNAARVARARGLTVLSLTGEKESELSALSDVCLRLPARVARARGLTVLSLTGEKESELSALSDVCLRLPARETARVQEYTLPVYHALCALLEDEFFLE